MILIISLIFTMFLFILYKVFGSTKKDIFSPISLSLFFVFITNIPYILSLHFNYDLLNLEVQARISASKLPLAILQYILLLMPSVLFLILGIRSSLSKKITNKLPVLLYDTSYTRYNLAAFTALILGIIAYQAFFQEVGGIVNWIENLNARASFTTGNGYLMSLMGLLPIGVYTFIYTFRYKNNPIRFIVLFILFFIAILLTSSLGGRKSTLFLIAYSLIVWNYGVREIKNLSAKVILLIPIISIYVLAVPIIRSSSQEIESLINNPTYLMEEVEDNVNTLSKQISYVDHQLLIMDHFDAENIWLGKSYIDLLYAPVPRSIYPDKPPIDDGVYVRSIAAGYDVEPPQSYDTMFQSSWPPETFGAAYMNFSSLGVLISMYFLGIVYGVSYRYMKKSNFSLFSILIYGNVITNFHFSNLRIIQTASTLILLLFFFSIFLTIKNAKSFKVKRIPL